MAKKYIRAIIIENGKKTIDPTPFDDSVTEETEALKKMAADINRQFPGQYETDKWIKDYEIFANFAHVFYQFCHTLGISEEDAIDKYCTVQEKQHTNDDEFYR